MHVCLYYSQIISNSIQVFHVLRKYFYEHKAAKRLTQTKMNVYAVIDECPDGQEYLCVNTHTYMYSMTQKPKLHNFVVYGNSELIRT